jgi:dolichol-phosphate mannosyltransferase
MPTAASGAVGWETEPGAAARASAEPSRPQAAWQGGVELSVIVPTFNERDNVRSLVARLEACLADVSWEVIFVDDDSPDGTAELVRQIAAGDRRVRCLQRLGRRGLSSACIEGMLATAAPYLAVIDGDLQHDETLLPQMLAALQAEDLDIVVGSRYLAGGGLGGWDPDRAAISRAATRLSRLVLRARLSDPMSGFFMLRRRVLEQTARRLSGIGFKILVDLFASAPRPLRFKELPYQFRMRQAGESKLDVPVAWDYAMLLLDKLVGHFVPARFVSFMAVGGVGIAVHLLSLHLLFNVLGLDFLPSHAAATAVAMTSNFALNNLLTYRDLRLSGWGWLRGWISFTLACSIGAIANVGIASYLFGVMDTFWLVSALAGILVGVVWNYAVTSVYTWRVPRAK